METRNPKNRTLPPNTQKKINKKKKKNKKLQPFYTKIGVEEKNKESISKSQSRNNNNMRRGDDWGFRSGSLDTAYPNKINAATNGEHQPQ